MHCRKAAGPATGLFVWSLVSLDVVEGLPLRPLHLRWPPPAVPETLGGKIKTLVLHDNRPQAL